MSMTVELVTKLRDQLSGPLARQSAALGTWQAKAALAAAAAVGAGLAIARLTQQFIALADRVTQPLSRIQDLSEGLNVSASDMAALSYVVNQAGGESSALAPAFQRMRVAIDEAGDSSSASAQALDRLNLSQAELLGMNPVQQYIEISGALGQYAGTAAQGAIAQDLLGRGAMNLRGSLSLSAATLRDGMEAARGLGVVLGDDAYAAADEFQDMMKTVKDQLVALQMEGLQPNLPKIAELLTSLIEMGREVLPMVLDEVGDMLGVLADLASAFTAVQNAVDQLTPDIVEDFRDGMTGWEKFFSSPGFLGIGTQISVVRQAIEGLGDSAEEAVPQGDMFAGVMELIRDAASQAEAEVEALNEQLDGAVSAMMAKKDASWGDVLATREGAGGGGAYAADVEAAQTAEEMKLEAVEERISAEKSAEIERIQMIEDAEMASADRIAAKTMQAAAETKRAQMQMEIQAAAERERLAAEMVQGYADAGAAVGDILGQVLTEEMTVGQGMVAVTRMILSSVIEMVTKSVIAKSLDAAAGAASSQAGIPIIGPFLAAAAMGSMLALVQGLLGGMPGMASGGMIVPGAHMSDRVPALLTPGERVLTRAEARDYAGASGGSRGDTTVNVTLGSMFSSASRSELIRAGRTLREVMQAEGLL
jgi:hypothetical protein